MSRTSILPIWIETSSFFIQGDMMKPQIMSMPITSWDIPVSASYVQVSSMAYTPPGMQLGYGEKRFIHPTKRTHR